MKELKSIGFEIGVLKKIDGRTYATNREVGDWEASWEDETPDTFEHIIMYNLRNSRCLYYGQNEITRLQEDFSTFFDK